MCSYVYGYGEYYMCSMTISTMNCTTGMTNISNVNSWWFENNCRYFNFCNLQTCSNTLILNSNVQRSHRYRMVVCGQRPTVVCWLFPFSVLMNCVTPRMVRMLKALIVLCCFGLVFDFLAFLLELMASSRKSFIALRRNAVFSIATGEALHYLKF